MSFTDYQTKYFVHELARRFPPDRVEKATMTGTEGINLQFNSLLVNYDLPWKPQRIEQRIGRCHRCGQQHDVVVVNFLNRKNAPDKNDYEDVIRTE